MNTIKLNIKTSDTKDLLYKIYRSEIQEQLAPSLDVLKDLQPVMEIDESAAVKSNIKITEELRVDVSVSSTNVVQYKLRNKPVKSDMCNMEVIFNYNSPNEIIQHSTAKFLITFGKSGSITALAITKPDKSIENISVSSINNYITINDNTITLSSDYSDTAVSIECNYFIEAMVVNDTSSSQAGLAYYGPEPIGIGKPVIDFSYKILNTINKVYVPYFILTPEDIPGDNYQGQIYYYRVVAVNKSGANSHPSSLIATELAQPADQVKHYIEISKDYNIDPENATWINLTVAESSDLLEIGKVGTTTYSVLGSAVNKSVPVFDSSEILINHKYVYSDSKLVLTLPNVWKLENERFNYRYHNAYRITAELNGKYSAKSDVFTQKDKAHIPVEKMVVIKRVVTGEPLTEQLRPSDIKEGIIIKTYIRKNGYYYDEAVYMDLPQNVIHSTSPMDIMTEGSLFEAFKIEDGCLPGEEYNYTVYLYDSYGTESAPIVTRIEI